MVECRRDTRLAEEMLVFARCGSAGQEYLDSHWPREMSIDPPEYRCISAFANKRIDGVSSSQCSAEQW